MTRKIKHGTLTAGSVTTVSLNENWSRVQVISRTGGSEIYFTVGTATPTVKGDDCFVVTSGTGSYIAKSEEPGATTVKLISAGSEQYSVIGL